LVARGDLQKKGVDYQETFALVISFPSLWIILAIAAKHDLEIGQLDVISAFLNGLIDTVVYLRQPDGFSLGSYVYIRHKSIYRLRQAAKLWYEILDVTFETFGFRKVIHDGALWYKPHPAIISDPTITRNPTPTDGVDGCYALAHVDVVGTVDKVRPVKGFLNTKLKIKDLEDVSVFTGLLIQPDKSCRTLQISQGHYARQPIETYGMQNCKVCQHASQNI